VLVVGFFFPGLFFNHLPQVFITTDIYIKIRYLFMLNAAVLAACFSCSSLCHTGWISTQEIVTTKPLQER